jgi:hypothetical protein
MSKCLKCGTEGAYQGLFAYSVECVNPKCEHFVAAVRVEADALAPAATGGASRPGKTAALKLVHVDGRWMSPAARAFFVARAVTAPRSSSKRVPHPKWESETTVRFKHAPALRETLVQEHARQVQEALDKVDGLGRNVGGHTREYSRVAITLATEVRRLRDRLQVQHRAAVTLRKKLEVERARVAELEGDNESAELAAQSMGYDHKEQVKTRAAQTPAASTLKSCALNYDHNGPEYTLSFLDGAVRKTLPLQKGCSCWPSAGQFCDKCRVE